jgi:hypothetical protein
VALVSPLGKRLLAILALDRASEWKLNDGYLTHKPTGIEVFYGSGMFRVEGDPRFYHIRFWDTWRIGRAMRRMRWCLLQHREEGFCSAIDERLMTAEERAIEELLNS